MRSKRVLLVAASAIAGFGIGMALPVRIEFTFPFRIAQPAIWFANMPGFYLFSSLPKPRPSLWLIPIGNALAYALIATFLMLATKFIRKVRNIQGLHLPAVR